MVTFGVIQTGTSTLSLERRGTRHHGGPRGSGPRGPTAVLYIHWRAFSAFWVSVWDCALSPLTLWSLEERSATEDGEGESRKRKEDVKWRGRVVSDRGGADKRVTVERRAKGGEERISSTG